MGCDCFQIGGPWIAEDPNCPAHGKGGLQEELDDAMEEIARLREENAELRILADCHDRRLMEHRCRHCSDKGD